MRRLFFAHTEVGDFFGFKMFDRIGPFPHDYEAGLCSAIGTLWQSQRPGRMKPSRSTHLFARSGAFTPIFTANASAKAVLSSLVWRSEKGCFITTTAPSD
jgi:hypothetical protein